MAWVRDQHLLILYPPGYYPSPCHSDPDSTCPLDLAFRPHPNPAASSPPSATVSILFLGAADSSWPALAPCSPGLHAERAARSPSWLAALPLPSPECPTHLCLRHDSSPPSSVQGSQSASTPPTSPASITRPSAPPKPCKRPVLSICWGSAPAALSLWPLSA